MGVEQSSKGTRGRWGRADALWRRRERGSGEGERLSEARVAGEALLGLREAGPGRGKAAPREVWAGSGWALERPGSLFSLKSLKKPSRNQKTAKKERREKKRLEEGFVHAEYFPGLAKICLFRENRKDHDRKI